MADVMTDTTRARMHSDIPVADEIAVRSTPAEGTPELDDTTREDNDPDDDGPPPFIVAF